MMSILRQMAQRHYDNYIDQFETPIDVNDFLMEILTVIEDLVRRNVYPADWNEIIILQNWFVTNLFSDNTLFHFICFVANVSFCHFLKNLKDLFYDLIRKFSVFNKSVLPFSFILLSCVVRVVFF